MGALTERASRASKSAWAIRASSTTAPPISAARLGSSPRKSQTQTGAKITSNSEIKLASAERTKLRVNATQSFEAWSSYAAGLDAQDKGDVAAARAAYAKALAADPNYRAAKTATERLAAIFAQSAKQTETRFDASS